MKMSYNEKDELVRRMIIVKVVDLMLSETFKTSKDLINSAESYFRKEYEVGNTYNKLVTSYQITDAFTRFCLDLPNINQYVKDNALKTLESFETKEEEDMSTFKGLEGVYAIRAEIFPKLFKHFSSKKGLGYEESIQAIIDYCHKENPKGIADGGKVYPTAIKEVLADTFYQTLSKMKTDPAAIIKVLMKNLSKEDLQEVIKNAQAYINN